MLAFTYSERILYISYACHSLPHKFSNCMVTYTPLLLTCWCEESLYQLFFQILHLQTGNFRNILHRCNNAYNISLTLTTNFVENDAEFIFRVSILSSSSNLTKMETPTFQTLVLYFPLSGLV